MKICFLSTIEGHPWGGADFMWTRAAEAASARGDHLLLGLSASTAAHPRVAALEARGAELLLRAPAAARASFVTRMANRLRRRPAPVDPVIRALGAFSPALVVISCGATYDLAYFPEWVGWLAKTRTPFRLIANWQAEQPALPALEFERIADVLVAAEALYFVSERNLAVTRRHLQRPLANARVLHNPLRWSPADASPFPESNTARFATVSRLDESKGLHLLLHALKEIEPDAPAWQLAIHGRGPQENALRDLVTQLGLQERVSFRGHVADLRAIWSEHQLLCSPAINEGVPMTVPEAMLCGRPVLATAVGGAEDWLQNRETGFICAAPTVSLLAATLQVALAARAQWPRMGRDAAATAHGYYRPHDYEHVIAPLA